MNPITIGMDVLLAALLLAALWMGARLNGRLMALKESHQGFASAVQTLDAAATKADAALKALHAASDEAHDSLLARIDTARSLALKLEKASETAERAAARAEEAFGKAPLAVATPAAVSTAPRRSLGDLLASRATSSKTFEPEAQPVPAPVATVPRRRPIADEDPVRRGGRRRASGPFRPYAHEPGARPMNKIPRLLPLVGVAIGGVIAAKRARRRPRPAGASIRHAGSGGRGAASGEKIQQTCQGGGHARSGCRRSQSQFPSAPRRSVHAHGPRVGLRHLRHGSGQGGRHVPRRTSGSAEPADSARPDR